MCTRSIAGVDGWSAGGPFPCKNGLIDASIATLEPFVADAHPSLGALKSERHHWWPRCLSDRWKGSDGCVGWLTPDDVLTRAPPKNFGVIGNGHHIRLGRGGYRDTPFDESFEGVFQRADDGITRTVDWLSRLVSDPPTRRAGHEGRFSVHPAPDDYVARLVELLVSLAIRSPMNRQAAVALAEALRGPLPEAERNALIGLNMRDSHSRATASVGTWGKFVVLSSPAREFIFGDGFFHNVTSPAATPVGAKILAPLLPRISVLRRWPPTARPGPAVARCPALGRSALHTTTVPSAQHADRGHHAQRDGHVVMIALLARAPVTPPRAPARAGATAPCRRTRPAPWRPSPWPKPPASQKR